MVIKGKIISTKIDKETIKKLKDEKIKFVMIRAGFTDYDKNKTKRLDNNFYENYKILKKNNIKIGTYYTFLATTINEAQDELSYFINIIKDKVFEYPVVIQIEDDHNTIIYYPENQKTIDKNILLDTVSYIYRKLDNYGYRVLIRTYESWYNDIFSKNNDYNYWIDRAISNKYLFYSNQDDIVIYNKDMLKDDDIKLVLNENCFLDIIKNYVKAGYKILKSKIRKR